MKLSIRQLVTWSGSLTRAEYLSWGCLLFAIKYNLDRIVAASFDRTWYLTDYFLQVDRLAVEPRVTDDAVFYLTLLATSIPFIWCGTVLCTKRLRNAGISAWLVIFFFVPFINFILFVVLSALPERATTEDRQSFIARLVPKSKVGSALFSIGVVSLIALSLTGLIVQYWNDYGWSVFVGIPFLIGFASVLLYGYHRKLSYGEALGVTVVAVLLFSAIIFVLAMEGLICLAMALPILLCVAFIGGTIGYAIHTQRNQRATLNLINIPILTVLLTGVAEHYYLEPPPVVHVETSVVINASKQQVWDQLVTFDTLEKPQELLFKSGIAYPIQATIDGRGVGAVRKCTFTTGSFIEPITIWNEPHLLEFSVLDQPPPMMELSFYEDLEIAHLDNYFKSVKGQFKLEEMSDGRTLLTGTTWYHHAIWPSVYWKLWSDRILHKIHYRVLHHIQKKAESQATELN